jgi:hypothetical protein
MSKAERMLGITLLRIIIADGKESKDKSILSLPLFF